MRSDDRRGQDHAWQDSFQTVPDDWIEVRLPCAAPTHLIMRRGWTIPVTSATRMNSTPWRVSASDPRPAPPLRGSLSVE